MDFFVEASEENARRIIAALKECGFPLSGLSSSDFTVGGRVVHLGHVPLRIVVMTASDGLAFETAWERKVAGASGDQPVHFISREDLIANKKASARKEDLPDLESLI